MNSVDFSLTHGNKVRYADQDQRLNLHELETTKLDQIFVSTVKEQAKSVACMIFKEYLLEKDSGWQLHPQTRTLAAIVEQQPEFGGVTFGEKEAFRDEVAPGFGTAFLVGKQLAMTAAHCVCQKDSDILDQAVIRRACLVFGFHEIKAQPSDYFFTKHQVYQIKKVVSHQFIRDRDNKLQFTDWTDWALLELTEEAPFTPLPMNMTEKVASSIELYMLGHPSGLPLKFTGNGFVLGNTHKDFFECNLDAFGGNSGSFVAAKSTQVGSGMLCSGGTDYEITDNYQGTGQRRIQARLITKKQIAQNKIGERYENCQRIDTLRFLLSPELLGIQEIPLKQYAPEQIVNAIQENYRSKNTVPRLLNQPLSIEEVYTELVLLEQAKEEEKAVFKENRINSWEDVQEAKKPIELKNFFSDEGVQKRFLILGRAGIGKSILCQYIAYQWACGKLWSGKFDALFWVPLRKAQHAHSAENTASFLFRHCCQEYGKTLYPHDVADYLQKNKGRILFVLDGLDEVSLEENSVQKGIVDELLTFPYWILTSRPHAAAAIQADATIENVGFASTTIDNYIEKSFPTHAQAISQSIRQNPIIFGLCHIPINLELVCSILKKSKDLLASISSMTGLYEEITLTLQRRFLEKIGKPSAWHWGPKDMEKDAEISILFKTLESIAWEGMGEKALYFSFKQGAMEKIYYDSYPSYEADKRETLFTNICNSGFLQSHGENLSFLDNEYFFLHLTFQEFFAARFLASLFQSNPMEAKRCLQEVKFNPRYKVVMWFLAGLLKRDPKNLTTFFHILDTSQDLVGFYSAFLKVRCLEECEWSDELQNEKLLAYEKEIQSWSLRGSTQRPYYLLERHLLETFVISPRGAKRLFASPLSLQFLKAGYIKEAVMYEIQVQHDSYLKNAFSEKIKNQTGQIPLLVFEACKYCLGEDRVNKDVVAAAKQLLVQEWQKDPQSLLPLLIEIFEVDARGTIELFSQLGQTHPQLIVPLLTKTIKESKDYYPRLDSVMALGQIGKVHPKLVFPLLTETLHHEDGNVVDYAKRALAEMGETHPQLVIPLLPKMVKEKKCALDQIGQCDLVSKLPLLTKMLKNKDVDKRNAGLKVLNQIGKTDPNLILPLLTDALKDENDHFRKQVTLAVITLSSQIGQADSQPVLLLIAQALEYEEYYIRRDMIKILEQLGQTHPQLTFPLLKEALKSNYDDTKIAAIEALAQLRSIDPELLLSSISTMLKDKNVTIVLSALGQIGLFNLQFNFSILAKMLNSALKDKKDGFEIGCAVVAALKQLGKINPQSVVPIFEKALKVECTHWERESSVQDGIVYALRDLGQAHPHLVLPLLTELFKNFKTYPLIAFRGLYNTLSALNDTHPQLFKMSELENILSSAKEKILQDSLQALEDIFFLIM
jgi:HEAT repeat protein/V8-like Glu-specific endopeptidase